MEHNRILQCDLVNFCANERKVSKSWKRNLNPLAWAEDVYLERSIGKSPLANPFILNARKPEDRDTVIRMFKAYLNWATSIAQTDPRYDRMIDYQGLTRKILHGLEISSPIPFVHLDVSPRTIQRELKILEARLRKGESLRLVCWCHPLPCHTEIVRDYLLKRLIAKNLN